ncbi:non-specific lipid-transfer protein A-like [Asparagus officinalis]|uniref:non-specific lipid-transfer protein A-like n=1 Tax=Asparagus officinalis TaxID=4686 RepID=UPI00098E6EC0|nr:non-specific lipid-transfer protein A-like [Asparagus officinalis]
MQSSPYLYYLHFHKPLHAINAPHDRSPSTSSQTHSLSFDHQINQSTSNLHQMAPKASLSAFAFLFLAMAHLVVQPSQAINCVDVDVALRQCVPYITGQAPNPAKGCCDGIGHIKSIATTKADRQAACGCMKAAASHLPGIVDSAVTALPAKCNVPLPYPISASVDCSKIQ